MIAMQRIALGCFLMIALALAGCSKQSSTQPTTDGASPSANAAKETIADRPLSADDIPAEPIEAASTPKKPNDSRSSISRETAAIQVAAAAPIGDSADKSNFPAPPTPPKVSAFAPAEDLAEQFDFYMKSLETESLVDETSFKDYKDKIAQDANTLIVVALCLGMHDQESKYKSAAPVMIKTAQALAAATDFPNAQKAFEALKASTTQKASSSSLKWEKVAALPELMKQVPSINTKLKRNVKGSRFKKNEKSNAGMTAVIAAIAQGSVADLSEAKTPEQAKQWYEFSVKMRDTAGEVNAAVHAKDEVKAGEAMTRLNESCDQCHKVFHPDVTQ